MAKTIIGIIGGSGFYQLENAGRIEAVKLATPFGEPSDLYYKATLGEAELVFLSRHGQDHRIAPSEINFRANIFGMKELGVEYLISISAAGSMKETIAPGDLVIPDQFIDRTFKRPATFFGGGIVAHVAMADPVCGDLAADLAQSAQGIPAPVHRGGTYLCIEGPQFSTRAESRLYRSWGVDVISMTAMQEARLAREAELCYAALALVTDYDCWHRGEKSVEIGDILAVLKKNVAMAQRVVARLAGIVAGRSRKCECGHALAGAIVTDRAAIPAQALARLKPLVAKYF